MTDIIDADAAKLAGLQIDLLQKYRAGKLGLTELEMFLKLAPKDRANRFGDWKQAKADFLASVAKAPPVESEKFALLLDLGSIEVPAEWSLDTFRQANKKGFYYFNPDLTEAKHPTPKWAAGKRYSVRAYHQIVTGTTSSRDRLEFLESQGATSYLGAQGAALVYQEKRTLLPKGKWYSSFTEGDLARARGGLGGRVPNVDAYSIGDFVFSLGYLGNPWDRGGAFLGFCELLLEA